MLYALLMNIFKISSVNGDLRTW